MSYTLKQIITDAFVELGLGQYDMDLRPEEIEHALYKLNTLLAEWNGKGLSLGVPLPFNPQDSDITAASNIPDYAVSAVTSGLALKIAPLFGKIVPPETIRSFNSGYQLLLNRALSIPEKQQPAMMAGAGHRFTYPNGFSETPEKLTLQRGSLDF